MMNGDFIDMVVVGLILLDFLASFFLLLLCPIPIQQKHNLRDKK